MHSSTKPLPKVPETLLKRRKQRAEAREKAVKAADVNRKVRSASLNLCVFDALGYSLSEVNCVCLMLQVLVCRRSAVCLMLQVLVCRRSTVCV